MFSHGLPHIHPIFWDLSTISTRLFHIQYSTPTPSRWLLRWIIKCRNKHDKCAAIIGSETHSQIICKAFVSALSTINKMTAAKKVRSRVTALTRWEFVLVAFRTCAERYTVFCKLCTQLLFHCRWNYIRRMSLRFDTRSNFKDQTPVSVVQFSGVGRWINTILILFYPETDPWNSKIPQGHCWLEKRNWVIYWYKGPWSV
jgi:hypothetical protein